MRAFVVVLDSVGIGAAPDAAEYGDVGANTLAHIAQSVGGLRLPNLRRLGLGFIPGLIPDGIPIRGVREGRTTVGSYGAMQAVSRGKDTTTGHWEMAGLHLREGFRVFPAEAPSFPEALVREFERRTGRSVIGNYAVSGTVVIQELGEQHLQAGSWIVYTSADSVFQVAAHEAVIPLDELYRGCEIARELCDPLQVGRVIARPFIGTPGAFTRTENRRDFSMPVPEPTILDRVAAADYQVVTVGKLDDVFAGCRITKAYHVENNADAEVITMKLARNGVKGLIFVNLIDFDMLYGHRRDPQGYAKALEQADRFVGALMKRIATDDLLIITADHGNDPTFKGTDHTREYVPLLVYGGRRTSRSLGIRAGFFDIAQSVASFFGLAPMPRGVSFL